ncbi:MAG: restriction endonuclease, partial [Oscillospiraceae bacterium]|nr:restriction endonuclease [Oscillospiraceae bacterium]
YFPLSGEELQPLSSLSALLVCSNRRQAEEPLLGFLAALPPCLQQEAALQLTTQLLIGCFAAQLLCLTYARGIARQDELAAILANAGKEYDLLERIVEATYPIYLRYYTDCTNGEQLNREEYGMLLFFYYRSRMEEPLRRLAADLDPLPPEKGQSAEQWLQQTMGRAITLRHQTFLEMDDEGLRRCLLALLCALQPHPDLPETCALLSDLENMVEELKENALSCRMDVERSRLLDGDFSEANRTYAAVHSLEQVENGLQFEEYLGRLFAGLGYQVSTTSATADHGVDLILSKGGIRYALQAKFYSGKVGNKAVQEVYSGMSIWGASAAVVVTTSSFTPQAVQDAAQLGVTLVDGQELHRLIDLGGTAAGFAHRFD